MNLPLVSIIIPAHNASKHIIETLISIKEQTYTNWEIILVNDCSTDNTVKLVKKFSAQISNSVTLITNEINSGVSVSRNVAVENASGSWLALLDSDDIWLSNHLETLINEVNKDSQVDVVFSGFQAFLDVVDNVLFKQEILKDMLENFNISLYSHLIGITSSTALINKSSWNNIGGMIKGLNYCEEMELFIRLAKAGAKFKFSGFHSTLYRKHRNSSSASDNPVKMALGTLYIYQKHFDWEKISIRMRINLLSKAHLTFARLVWRADIKSGLIHGLKSLKIKAGLLSNF
jgi:glycosyltransferase involved in cell wall biosynthesis